MTFALDYAQLYEQDRRRRASIRYVGVIAVWLGLFVIRPRLALKIIRERAA
jgi:hypothetical protein